MTNPQSEPRPTGMTQLFVVTVTFRCFGHCSPIYDASFCGNCYFRGDSWCG